MFDLISGGPRHPFHDRTFVPTFLSVIGHFAIITVVVLIPLLYATASLPTVPAMMAFVAAEPVAPPSPPPPAPPPPAAAKAVPVRPQPAPTAGQFAAPIEAPAEIRPEPPGVVAEAAGVPGGVEGGVTGGVVGGIVGGLVAAAPPPPPPPLPPPPKTPVRIGGNIQAPTLVRRVEPAYPEIAVVAKVGGIVILEATVGVDGAVESVRVLRGVKFLDQAAVDAVKQWRYSPLVLNGLPTPFVLSVTLSFSVKEG